ncbi:hypothetical protein M408DRAFT_252994 [Serendipita vermifera MAFF 305830]|uniref:MYND-type domain-containing protein n=1 Tax=Serendipita vermifera MAFF 305830 TaxID=933852 RepID=A0A0C3AFV4_SERVB|nr:hypothetical protein M408DRAFT_252994 [Serendipita vermifera MAFF 305830]
MHFSPGSQPFIVPDEMAQLLASPELLKREKALRLRKIYQDNADNFNPLRDLSNFGRYCFLGQYDKLVKEYNETKPNLRATETSYKWGYISLASNGSRCIRTLSQFSPFIPTLLFLIGSGAPVDLPDIAGLTALHHVAMNNRVGEVLQILLAAGANPNIRDIYGTSPLHGAVQYDQIEAVEMCMKHGGDIHLLDNDGYSPFAIVRYASPTMHATIHKYLRLYAGVVVPMEERGKCAACGKMGCKSQCSRCRVVRYCSPECQVSHWKNGHKTTCVPFNSVETTVVCRPSFGTHQGEHFPTSAFHNHVMADDIGDGERERRRDEKYMAAYGLREEQNAKPAPKAPRSLKFVPFRHVMLGKSMIVKLQLPVGPYIRDKPATKVEGQIREILVYNRNRDFVCTIIDDLQPEVYTRLETVIKDKGSLGGLKGYFAAELESQDRLKVKIGDILADQPW